MKKFVVLNILIIATLILAACAPAAAPAAAAPKPEKKITIGMANFSLCCAYFIGMSKAVQDEASSYSNIEVIVTDANGDAEKFTSDVEDLIAKKVDGLVVSGAWLESAPALLEAIQKANIPVVQVDRNLKGGEYTSFVGPDNYKIGQQDGQFIAKRLDGKGKVVVLKGGPADNSTGYDRTNGMLSIIKPIPGIEIVEAPNFGGWSEDGGLKLMEDLLASNNKIDAVFCENDSMCLGAQRAISDAKRSDEMFLVGVDGQKEALVQILNKSNYAATGLNNSDQIGRAGFNRLVALLLGAKAEKITILPSPIITLDNVVKFYDPDSLF
jgi:ABC-type sugar transport system substrate-binding protein